MLNSRSAEVEALESKLGQTRDYERSMDVLRSELLLARDSGRMKKAELDKLKEENIRLWEIKKSMAEGKITFSINKHVTQPIGQNVTTAICTKNSGNSNNT